MKQSLEFNFYLEMWAYIVRSKLQKIAKWRKEGIKKYILEWDDGKPEPAPKIKKAKQHE